MKFFAPFLAFILLLPQLLLADIEQDQTVHTTTKIAEIFAHDKNLTIPKSFKQGIKAVAIIPNLIKAGFLATYQEGVGIFCVKLDSGEWSPPIFVRFRGLGAGVQVGYESGDMVFLFRNKRSYSGLFNGADTIDFGGDMSIGGKGYSKSFLTDLPQISADVVALGRSNGYFIGISIDGSKMSIQDQDTIDYYGRMYQIKDILSGSAKLSGLSKSLLKNLKKAF